jgi:hypothetical protein
MVVDDDFPDRAQVTFPPSSVLELTNVAIDVFVDPLEFPMPTGFAAPGTYYVNLDLDPEPATSPCLLPASPSCFRS